MPSHSENLFKNYIVSFFRFLCCWYSDSVPCLSQFLINTVRSELEYDCSIASSIDNVGNSQLSASNVSLKPKYSNRRHSIMIDPSYIRFFTAIRGHCYQNLIY